MPVPPASRLILQARFIFQWLVTPLPLQHALHMVSRNPVQKRLRLASLRLEIPRLLNQCHKRFLHHLFRRLAPTCHVQRKPEDAPLVPPVKQTESLFLACRNPPQQKLVPRFVPLRHPFPFDVSAALLVLHSPAPALKFQKLSFLVPLAIASKLSASALAFSGAGAPCSFFEHGFFASLLPCPSLP